MPSCDRTQRHFTEAAREAAALARRRRRERREQFPEEHTLVMVVTRAGEGSRDFVWQIRQFGHMGPVAQSDGTFADPDAAGRSGRAMLARMRDAMAHDPSLQGRC